MSLSYYSNKYDLEVWAWIFGSLVVLTLVSILVAPFFRLKDVTCQPGEQYAYGRSGSSSVQLCVQPGAAHEIQSK